MLVNIHNKKCNNNNFRDILPRLLADILKVNLNIFYINEAKVYLDVGPEKDFTQCLLFLNNSHYSPIKSFNYNFFEEGKINNNNFSEKDKEKIEKDRVKFRRPTLSLKFWNENYMKKINKFKFRLSCNEKFNIALRLHSA